MFIWWKLKKSMQKWNFPPKGTVYWNEMPEFRPKVFDPILLIPWSSSYMHPPLNSSYRGKNLRINSYFGKFFWRLFFWSSLGIQWGGRRRSIRIRPTCTPPLLVHVWVGLTPQLKMTRGRFKSVRKWGKITPKWNRLVFRHFWGTQA